MSNESIRNTIALTMITLIAGLLLGLVYEITKEPIILQQQKAKEEAYKEVYADATSFEKMNINVSEVDELLSNQGFNVTIHEVMKVLDQDGKMHGYVLTVTDHEGYGGDIKFAMGVKLDHTLNGISFLTITETAGLGMKAKEESFMKQFENVKAEEFTYTKHGAKNPGEIDAISGATITTNAVVNGVNAGLYYVSQLEE